MARFSVKDGHSVSIGETVNSMQTVVLSGHTDEDIGGVVRFMEFVAEVVRDFRKVGEPITVTDKQTPKGSPCCLVEVLVARPAGHRGQAAAGSFRC